MIYPKPLENLIESFKLLPGIGEKSAERLALSVLAINIEDIENFSFNLVDARNNLHECVICGNLTDNDKCFICANDTRNKSLICIVEDYKSVFMFEKMGKYDGVYHVLSGLISPIDGIGPDDINIDSLIKRCKESNDRLELIIALKPSIEGETTTQFIKKMLEKMNIDISRLSYGIPIGADIDYLDVLTLERAFEDRKFL